MVTVEDVREFWDRRPCNVRHSPLGIDEYPQAYSRGVTNRKYFVEPHILGFARFHRWRDRRVLDMGCGIGTDTLSFASCGAFVDAVDISPKSLEIARKRAVAMGVDGQIQFIEGNIEDLDIHERRYDLVYSFGVIHHTPNPRAAVETALRLVKPGGVFKCMLYHRVSWRVLEILFEQHWWFEPIDEVVRRASEAQSGVPIGYTYTARSATELLRGFDIEELRFEHIFPYRVRDYINYRYVLKWYWRWMPPGLFRWMERHFGWHMLITARPHAA